MSKTYRTWNPDQNWLLPPSPRQWLPEGDLVYFILDVAKTLDLSAITCRYEQAERGYPPGGARLSALPPASDGHVAAVRVRHGRVLIPPHPEVVRAGCGLSRDRGRGCANFRTISDFRKDPLAALQGLFVQVLKLCAAAGLVTLGLVSLDGSKVKASASRHKAMSYEY